MSLSNNTNKSAKKKKRIWIILGTLPVVLFIVASAIRFFAPGPQDKMRPAWRSDQDSSHFVTSPVSLEDILVKISATGTLEPEKVIDVGAQVAGQILSFGEDADGQTIDYGSRVEENMILARIDDSLYRAGVEEVKAQILANEALLLRGKATLKRAEAQLIRAEEEWNRARKLGPSEALSQSKYENYKSAYAIAKADIAVNEAEISKIKADIAQLEAALSREQRNFDYCTIRSPVKGVVIDRRVNIGQTVVASLSTPSLFLLAKDLRKMEIWVAVNEADIGKIKPGGIVTFTVDAFSGQHFRGEVDKIRLNASMTQNVVSYVVVVTIDNKDGLLLPYLTANVTFELDRRNKVFTVPKLALSWFPSPDLIATEYRDSAGMSGKKMLWVVEGSFVRPVEIRTGLSDSIKTEVEGDGLYEGLEVVTGIKDKKRTRGKERNGSGSDEISNPFAPKIPGRPGSGGPGGGRPGGGSGPPS